MRVGKVFPQLSNRIRYSGWTKLYETTLSSTSSSFTMSGLTGDTDKEYKLETRIVNGYNGAINVYARPNNDSGVANYTYQGLYGNNTDITSSRSTTSAFRLVGCSAIDRVCSSNVIIQAKSGYMRTALIESIYDITGATVTEVDLMVMTWNDTANEISSLVVSTDQTGGLGIGSNMTLWVRNYAL